MYLLKIQPLQHWIKKINNFQYSQFYTHFQLEIQNQYLYNLKRFTPVGQYKTWRVGGVLKAGWKITKIIPIKNKISIIILNPTIYASFVEYGHRTPSGGFLMGRHIINHANNYFWFYDWKNIIQKWIKKMKELNEL